MHLKFGSHANVVPLICDARPEELEFCLFFPFYSNGSVGSPSTLIILIQYSPIQLPYKRRIDRQTRTLPNPKLVFDLFLAIFYRTQVLSWMEGISSALSMIHSQSFAHRDIKPHNILLTSDRKPMLTDFGSSVL